MTCRTLLLAVICWATTAATARNVHINQEVSSFPLSSSRYQQHQQHRRQELIDRNYHGSESGQTTTAEEIRAGKRLLQVFGLKEPKLRGHVLPPQYMLELYNYTATEQGFMKTANPYNANLIRSFTDKVRRRRKASESRMSKPYHVPTATALRFYFNLSRADPLEELLQAQFHIYKLRPKNRKFKGLLEVRAYQVMPGQTPDQEEGNRLLDVRRIGYDGLGWEVFYVKAAVDDWLRNPALNLGLFLTVRTQKGRRMPDQQFRFARKQIGTFRTSSGESSASFGGSTSASSGSVSKQPVLVVFSNDGRSSQRNEMSSNGNTTESYSLGDSRSRSRRSVPTLSPAAQYEVIGSTSTDPLSGHHSHYQDSKEPCARYDLYVDFEKIGWSSWIISPKGYQAYYCKGSCSFPLGQNQWPTNHATVQSIVNELGLSEGVGKPCCVPNKLYSISLLYYDDSENVILKQYNDMVAASCGCH